MTTRSSRLLATLLGFIVLMCLCAPIGSATTAQDGRDGDDSALSLREAPFPVPGLIGPDVPSSELGVPTTPPDDPQIGDSWLWWVWTHAPPPPHFAQVTCTVRGRTDHGYIVVENSAWNVRVFQHDVDQILERWENSSPGEDPDLGIYDLNSTYLGIPPDELDADPRIYLCWFNFGIPSDGFFFWFDEYPDGTQPPYHSNECEVVYMNTNNGQDPGGEYMISVAAHEFAHMIQWKYDENEDLWVNEGISEIAMHFYGHPDQISGFNGNADNPLTDFAGNWPDYIKTYLWTLYFYERYGGHPAIYSLVHEPGNGITGYENTLDAYGYSESVADVFADWAVANFLDDTSLADGRYGYATADLPPFNVMGTYSSYPVNDQARTVGHWATDYYRFQNISGFNALELGFNGTDANRFAVWGLAIRASGDTGVYRMTLDPVTQSGAVTVPGLASTDQVILVVSSVSSSGAMNYTFRADPSTLDAPDIATDLGAQPMLRIQPAVNPSSGSETRLLLSWSGSSETPAVDLYDTQGRWVQSLATAGTASTASGGETRLVLSWDGRSAAGAPAPLGMYYARARVGGTTGGTTLVRVR